MGLSLEGTSLDFRFIVHLAFEGEEGSDVLEITTDSSGGSRISPRRGRQLPRGMPTYDFVIFSRKLHEIERI